MLTIKLIVYEQMHRKIALVFIMISILKYFCNIFWKLTADFD